MADNSRQYDFYEEYVAVKSGHLLAMIEHLIKKMQQERCNVRHYKQWEAEMTAFKDEYRIFRKNILQRINDLQEESEQTDLEKLVGPCCEEIEDHYEIMAQIFLEKRNEIKDKTTYFETRNSQPEHHHLSLKDLYDKIDIRILWIKLKRR